MISVEKQNTVIIVSSIINFLIYNAGILFLMGGADYSDIGGGICITTWIASHFIIYIAVIHSIYGKYYNKEAPFDIYGPGLAIILYELQWIIRLIYTYGFSLITCALKTWF